MSSSSEIPKTFSLVSTLWMVSYTLGDRLVTLCKFISNVRWDHQSRETPPNEKILNTNHTKKIITVSTIFQYIYIMDYNGNSAVEMESNFERNIAENQIEKDDMETRKNTATIQHCTQKSNFFIIIK